MSSTGRAYGRSALDQYPTPPWCVERLLEGRVLARGSNWLEPAAGQGAIVDAVNRHYGTSGLAPQCWTAYEIEPSYHEPLRATGAEVIMDDFLRAPPFRLWDFGLGNPPYGLTRRFIAKMRECCRSFALLLPMNYLGTKARAAMFRRDMPDMAILPDRPSFVVKVTRLRDGTQRETESDSREYAWFIWPEEPRSKGDHFMLADTPPEVVKQAKALRPKIYVDEPGRYDANPYVDADIRSIKARRNA